MARQPDARAVFLGIDLGGTSIRCAIADSKGCVLAHRRADTPAQAGPPAVIQAIVNLAHATVKSAGIRLSQLQGAGIASPGPLNANTGVVFSMPNLPGWENVRLRDILQNKLGIPSVLGNDANAAALGEWYFGAGKGVANFIYVTISTGIGGGIIIDNKLYGGACGAAGEIGHMTIDVNGPVCGCGNNGCWEAMASGTALARRARQRISEGGDTSILRLSGGDASKITAQDVSTAARQGDTVARELIAEAACYLGVGFANLINLFNPELILVGGGLSKMGDMLLEPARQEAKRRAFKAPYEAVRFAPAALGEDSGVLGAVALVLQAGQG